MTTLRRTVDVVCILSAIGLLGGLGAWQLEKSQEKTDEQQLTDAVQDFDRVLKLRAATKDVELNGRGWPVTIDPAWFQGEPPRNPLVTPERPWVEVAPPEDADLTHPHVRVALDERYASFWYNPYQGIVRARVPLRINDALSLDLYNQVNGSSLSSIYETRQPPRPPAELPPEEPAPETDETPAPEFSPDEMDPTKPVPREPAPAGPPPPTQQAPPAAPPPAPSPVSPTPPVVKPLPRPDGTGK
jgi:hypothetical protein